MDNSIHLLLSKIEKTRMEMLDLASQYGYCSPYVVHCSQQLDHLLNDYNSAVKH